MQRTFFISLVVLLCAAVALAGCTGTKTPAGTTPTGSSSSGTSTAVTPASAAGNLVTSPTDVVPDTNTVSVIVQEKVYDGTIPVIFDGGKGQNLVKSIDVTLYRSDGLVKTAKIGTKKGDEAILEGTRQTDRVVVYVSEMNGQTYKVADVLSPYRVH